MKTKIKTIIKEMFQQSLKNRDCLKVGMTKTLSKQLDNMRGSQ